MCHRTITTPYNAATRLAVVCIRTTSVVVVSTYDTRAYTMVSIHDYEGAHLVAS